MLHEIGNLLLGIGCQRTIIVKILFFIPDVETDDFFNYFVV